MASQDTPNTGNVKKRGPVAQPSEYSGAGDWHTWLRKFKGLAGMYDWDEAEQQIWLDCKLTGQAALTLETLDPDTRKNFETTVEALTRRFEPEAKRLVYQEKLWAYQRKKGEDWASVAENLKELATRANPESEDLASGFAMSRFLVLLEEDSDLAIGVRRSGPKTLDEAVQEAIRLECINQAVHRRTVHVSAPVNVDRGLPSQGTDLAKSIQTLAEGIAGLKASQELSFASMKSSLSEHENRLRQLESARSGRAMKREGCFKCGRHGHIARNCRTNKFNEVMSKDERSDYPYRVIGGARQVCEVPGNGRSRVLTIPSKGPGNCFIQGYLANVPVSFLVDTGADVSVVRRDVWEESEGGELDAWGGTEKLIDASGHPMRVVGMKVASIRLGNGEFTHPVIVVEGLPMEALLGMDFIVLNGCVLDPAEGKIVVRSKPGMTLPLEGKAPKRDQVKKYTTACITLRNTIKIPPLHEVDVCGLVGRDLEQGPWLIDSTSMSKKAAIQVANALVIPKNGTVPVRLMNSSCEAITVYCGDSLARMELLKSSEGVTVGSLTMEECGEPFCTKPTKSRITPEKEEKLWEIAQRIAAGFSPEERKRVFDVLVKYEAVFPQKKEIGKTKVLQHHIHTGEAQPVRQRPRRTPFHQREESRKVLQDMLDKNIIQPSSSPWASPVVLVKKKDGSLRFCVDFRKLNSLTRKDAYALPRIDDTLNSLAGSKWFTTLDLASGSWQVEICPEDKEKTAFCTQDGHFEFNVMPFGLCNAPATFQRLMDVVLAGVQWSSCLVYLDDIIIMGRSFDEHLDNLSMVLSRLQAAGLTLNPDKCRFFQKKVLYLGHIVSEQGVTPDPEKSKVVTEWPTPTCLVELQGFLGLANYYRHFIHGYAEVAKPLHELSRKGSDFNWTSDCMSAFSALKTKLTSAPILAYPDSSKPFILDTDASNHSLGAVLSQIQDGKERVVCFDSRLLSKEERNYCVTRRELLAVVVFTNKFRHYLLGRPFRLRTDHGSLLWLHNFKEPEGQLARWIEKLQEFTYEIVHREGRSHNNADAMSRISCNNRKCPVHDGTAHTSGESAVVPIILPEAVSDMDVSSLQLQDKDIGPVLKRHKEGAKQPEVGQTKGFSSATRALFQQWMQLRLEEGVLYRQFENQDGTSNRLQLIVPKSLREEVLRQLHEGPCGGHFGEDKTLHRLRERFYWPGHQKDVINWCRTCRDCAARKGPAPKRRAPLTSIKVGSPLQIVAMDFLGPLVESEDGNRYILVVGDHFTKYMSAYAVPNQEAKTVARILVEEYFCQNGFPEQLHSDQGPQFESDVIAELCKTMSIQKTRTTPYHPSCNGEIERFNKTLCDILATALEGCHFTWDRHVKMACFAYNTSVHASTGYTPFYLMHGYEARLPVDLLCGTPQQENVSHSEYVAKVQKRMGQTFDKVREKTGQSQLRQKAFYDRRIHGERFNTGDLVWLWNPAVPRKKGFNCKKLHRSWQGPFEVIKQLSDVTYRIQHTAKRRQRQVVHFDRLKPCNPDVRLHKVSQPATTPQELRVSVQIPNTNPANPDAEEDTDDEMPLPHVREIEEKSEGGDVEMENAGQLPGQVEETDNIQEVLENEGSPAPDDLEEDAASPLEQRRYPVRERKEPDWFGNFVTH